MTREDSGNSHEPAQKQLAWPGETKFYLTLDFECDFGTALAQNTYQAVEEVDRLVSLLESYEIPLTCFVQTELLDVKPSVVESLRSCTSPVAFHPHSHTHSPREKASIRDEVRTSTSKFRTFFDTEPTGYRFPNGNIRRADYQILAEHDYAFDASVFPSWRPNHFNNTSAPTVPQYLSALDLIEIPFTVYSDSVRIPTALSYNRLLRRPFGWLLTRRPPSVVVYNIHMHDLVTPESFADLPRPYKLVYGQNDRGFELLERILDSFEAAEYSFETLDTLNEQLRERENRVEKQV